MATEVMKLNSGFDMPIIGLGTWLVWKFVMIPELTRLDRGGATF